MRFRNTVAVAILFLALGAYLYFVESEKIREEGKKETLLPLETEDINGITLEYPGEERTIALRKTGAGWRLQKPLEVEADETAVDNLARAIAEAELKRTLEGELEPLATYGLENPEIVVRVETTDGRSVPPIHVGKTTPVGYSTFVQLGDQAAVKLVSSAFSTGMKKELKDLRDKTILEFTEDDVRRIEISGPDETIVLARGDEDWTIESPKKLAADETEVRSFLSSLKSLRAQDFHDGAEKLGSFGLEPPRRRITLSVGKDDTRKTLLVGEEREVEKKKEIYVKRGEGDTVYSVAGYAGTNLGKTFSAFRDKTVLSFERADAGSIEVHRSDGESFRLVRKEAGAAESTPTEGGAAEDPWIVEGEPERSRASQVAQLVGDVHGLEGYEIAAENPEDLAAYGLAEPALAFSVLDREGQPVGRILASQVGESEGGEKRSYAIREGGDLVFRIRDYLYAHLDKKKVDLVEPLKGAEEAAPTVEAPESPPES